MVKVYKIQSTVTILTLVNLLFYFRTHVHCEELVERELLDTCSERNCDNNDILNEEKRKYVLDKAKEYYNLHNENNPDKEMTEEELKEILAGFRDKSIDINNIRKNDNEIDGESEFNRDDSDDDNNNNIVFEHPPLTRREATEVGEIIMIELEEGRTHEMIARSLRPPVFEIPNFLSDDECSHIIDAAKDKGLEMSYLFGSDVEKEFDDEDLADISRVSEQTWLNKNDLNTDFWDKLQQRLAKLTGLPLGLIERGEPIQVVKYAPGGHYHAHLDTIDGVDHLPCCFQTRCGDKELTPEWAECCRLCRFATVLYYLNEPEKGGETAFPLADMPEELVEEKFINVEEQEWHNLSYFCHNASLAVQPRKGTAILWYNHFLDEQTGYLGKVDRRSNHGGCDLKQGTKWIANNWISGTTFDERFKSSVFYTV